MNQDNLAALWHEYQKMSSAFARSQRETRNYKDRVQEQTTEIRDLRERIRALEDTVLEQETLIAQMRLQLLGILPSLSL